MTRADVISGRPGSRGGRTAVPQVGETSHEAGFLSLEWVLTLPVVALMVSGLLVVGGVLRDVLVLHEAARVAARAASVTADDRAVIAAARDAAPELAAVEVRIVPTTRRAGDQVTVTATTAVAYGPIRHHLSARSVALVEPVVEGPAPAGFPTRGWVPGPTGPTAPPPPTGPHDPWRGDP